MSHDGGYFKNPTKYSEEENQRCYKFVNKLKSLDDKTIFQEFTEATKSYQSGSLTYIELKNEVVSLLLNHHDLRQEFLSCFTSPARNSKIQNPEESDIERTAMFLTKLNALGDNVYKAFFDTLVHRGDIDVFVEQLDDVFGDHTALKEEFKEMLIEYRLFKPKVIENVTPSYQIIPDYVEGSCSHEVLNDKYYSVGEYDPDKVVEKKKSHWRDVKLDNVEDKLFEEEVFFESLASVIEFGMNDLCDKEVCKKLPFGFEEVVKRFHHGKKVPQIFRTDPRNAVRGILPRLQRMEKKMRKDKEYRALKMWRIYKRLNPERFVDTGGGTSRHLWHVPYTII